MPEGKNVVLGVTGGIAAYKVVEVASTLTQDGYAVDVIMTEAAQRFVGAMTFQAITQRPVVTDIFQPWTESDKGHISLAEGAGVIVVAPATANTIAKMASGMADNMLLAVVLASRAPVIIAPAMDANMWASEVTQANVETLRKRGATVVPPAAGRLASGLEGVGRLAEPRVIIGTIKKVLGRGGDLAGRRIVVTAGGTQEPLDPVRFIGNRSSGRMGYAIAQAAVERGAEVTLVSGPVSLPAPEGVELRFVETALEMLQAVQETVEGADALIMAAAVADYRPAERAVEKIKKTAEGLSIRLERNPDILKELSDRPLLKIGFAAETENLLPNAQRKLEEKKLDVIVGNDAAATIGREDAQVTILDRTGVVRRCPVLSKQAVAVEIVELAAARLKTG